MTEPQRERFLRLVLENPVNAALLERLPELGLQDWYLATGCLSQSVWNGLCDYPATHGILDYDVFYCDRSDLSWEAEDAAIQRCAAATADLDAEIQVRNQARVHLWYPQKHALSYVPLSTSRQGIDTFLHQSSCFGVRRQVPGEANAAFDIYAPFGFDDLFSMVVRPNPRIDLPVVYYEKAERWRSVWPDLTIHPWPGRGTPAAATS